MSKLPLKGMLKKPKKKVMIQKMNKVIVKRGSRTVAKLRGSARVGISTDETLALTRGKK